METFRWDRQGFEDSFLPFQGFQVFHGGLPATGQLVVLDLALPEVDGWAVLGRLRAEERTAAVPVLIVTARDDAETQQRARLAGASAYLTKPFDVGKFRAAVNELIG